MVRHAVPWCGTLSHITCFTVPLCDMVQYKGIVLSCFSLWEFCQVSVHDTAIAKAQIKWIAWKNFNSEKLRLNQVNTRHWVCGTSERYFNVGKQRVLSIVRHLSSRMFSTGLTPTSYSSPSRRLELILIFPFRVNHWFTLHTKSPASYTIFSARI